MEGAPVHDVDAPLRRTLLYVPGNVPARLQNLSVFGSDAVVIDLEDAVPRGEKDAARRLVRRFLEANPRRRQEIMVRVNPVNSGWLEDDLREVLPALPDAVRLPNADTPEAVQRLDALLGRLEEELGLDPGRFGILPSIESALGVLHCVEIARCSSRLVGLAFGAEDYTASMGIDRTRTGEELLEARARVVWAAKAAGLQAIDTIFADVRDVDGLRRETELARALGFTGKSVASPRQIEVVHEVFAPRPDEIAHALQVLEALQRGRELGTGVVSLGGKMVIAGGELPIDIAVVAAPCCDEQAT
jgi:citrate lyase subunit beta/citryl-CoA lyase